MNKCRGDGFNPHDFDKIYRVIELPTAAQKKYAEWFGKFDFQCEDEDWINFVNGTLNLFYHTFDPIEEEDGLGYIELMQSEVDARTICETQVYHGLPNINTFWKVDTNSKTEEVGGRRQGEQDRRDDIVARQQKPQGNRHHDQPDEGNDVCSREHTVGDLFLATTILLRFF